MESHVFLTHQAIRSLDGLTAFSALPDAPVLPVKERRRRRIPVSRLAAWKVRGAPRRERFTPATTVGRPCA